MEKEKIIKEMARDLSETYKGNDCLFTNACDICEYRKYQGNKEYPCGAMKHAKEMIVRGYRKERQGEWLPIWEDCSLVKCSACGYEYMDKIECSNYCGNCGAKMKGAE